MNCPSEREPIEISCPRCEEAGCETCNDRGTFEITHCPQKELDSELSRFLTLSDLFSKGLPPIAGGTLDQSEWFLNAHQLLTSEDNRVSRERMKD